MNYYNEKEIKRLLTELGDLHESYATEEDESAKASLYRDIQQAKEEIMEFIDEREEEAKEEGRNE